MHGASDRDLKGECKAAWWNGRHRGLKIPCSVRGVWVRVPPRPLILTWNSFRSQIHTPRKYNNDLKIFKSSSVVTVGGKRTYVLPLLFWKSLPETDGDVS